MMATMSTSWEKRARVYDMLQWANHDLYFETLLEELRLTGEEIVLDVGTGTGKVALHVLPYCRKVMGLDLSMEMLAIAHEHMGPHSAAKMALQQASIDRLPFGDGCFDVVVGRMVFHHLVGNLLEGINECFRVLRKGGRIVIAEGIPPNYLLKEDFVEIFSWKEARHTFLEHDIMNLLADAGFHRINIRTFFLDGISVNNWLEDAGLPEEHVEKILELHRNASRYFKKTYRLQELNGEILIDMKHAIVTAEKY
jgi:ubiquinone/menaquinone biosynthesis C-methylase UbiE